MEKIGTRTLTNEPEEIFNIIILDTIYEFRVQRNTLGFWTISVLDENGSPFVYGVKIVAGSFIFEPYVNLPFDLYIPGDVDPTRDDLNTYEIEVWEK